MSKIMMHEGVEYQVVEHDLKPGEQLLDLPEPTRPPDDCGHEQVKLCYYRLGVFSKPAMTYSPAVVIESPCGVLKVCVQCWSIRAPWDEEWIPDALDKREEIDGN